MVFRRFLNHRRVPEIHIGGFFASLPFGEPLLHGRWERVMEISGRTRDSNSLQKRQGMFQ